MRKLFVILTFLALVALACGTTTPVPQTDTPIPPPTEDVGTMVARTLTAMVPTVDPNAIYTQAAGTVVAQLTQNAPTAIVPTPTSTNTPPPAENAPDPLPASTTGVILNVGECFNFDNGQVTALDGQCDVYLASSNMIFQQVNGAQLSGYVTLAAPTRSHCVSGRYEPGDLAVQTDLYMCLITNEGNVGFLVVSEYRGSVPFTGIVFDYWVFR